MTRDRLAESREKIRIVESNGDGGSGQAGLQDADLNDVQYNSRLEAVVLQIESLDWMDELFEQVEDVRRLVEELKANVENVKDHQREILSTPIPDERKKQELDHVMSTVKRSSQLIRSKLKAMESGIRQEEEKTREDSTPASLRMRKTQYSSLLREFVEVMNEYQKVQIDYRDRCKGRIKRQIEITGSNFTDDEVETMIEEGNFTILTRGILIEDAKKMLADVQARHDDFLKLEKALKELHDLFLEMYHLVQSQGDIVDRIDNSVASTSDYIQRTKVQLAEAAVLQTSARKKKIWIIIVIVVIVILLGLGISLSIIL